MFFHPCRDVHQAAWDPCSYRWIIRLKREIELRVISITMIGEAMCLYDGTQWCSVCGEEEGPSDERVDRRIWWLTVAKAAERSSRMRTDDLESAFAIRRASVTESSAVSVEWPLLKPDYLASSLLYCERNNESWLRTTRSSIFATNGRRETGL